ncbi:hypothetical protein BH18THE2_BH18THE2_26300 [soil metagenome]
MTEQDKRKATMSNHHHHQQAIKIKEDYAALVPKLSQQDYESLKLSIKENGLYMPLIVNQDMILLDGHHRYNACVELRIDPKVEVKSFNDPLFEKLFVIHANMKRRQLTTAQKVEMGYTIKPVYEELARRNSLSNLKHANTNSDNRNDNENAGSSGSHEPVGRVNETIAKEVGLSRATYQRGETVLKDAPGIWNEQIRTGKLTINRAYNIHKKSLRKEELSRSAEAAAVSESIRLLQGDFVEKSTKEIIPNNAVDLMFTDPPYGVDAIPLYKDLAIIASRVLKDGGSLVTYAGHCMIPTIIHMMENAGLTFWWLIAIKLSGQYARAYHRGVSIKWKPLLWFVRGQKKNAIDFVSDYIESKAPEKVLHEWEQSHIEAEHIISRLTVENQLVFDPMMGSGTTGIAALRLNRKFLGIEIDKEKFEIAKKRMSK